MKIVLLSPPYLPDYMRNARCDFVSWSHTQWYPIWLGYCGAFLEKQGYDTWLVDAPSAGMDHDATIAELKKIQPDWVLLYTGDLSEDNDLAFAERILDNLKCKIAAAGCYASIDPEKTLKKTELLEGVIRGEFEYAFKELLEEKPHPEIKNLVYRDNGKIHSNEKRPSLTQAELDSIPFVSEYFSRKIDMDWYNAPSEMHPFMDVMTGRGCVWGHCTYCLWVHSFIEGSQYNHRTAENVIEEFKFIAKDLPHVRSLMIQDDTIPDEWGVELSEGIMSAGIKLPWSCYARPNLKRETMEVMKRAGCRNLHVGYESADKDVLKNIKKGVTKQTMERFTKDAHDVGLRIHGDFAIGFNGETEESALETIRWAKQLKPHTAQFQLMRPFACTPFGEYVRENDYLDKDGRPDYPHLSNERMSALSKKAYREFYISWHFAKQIMRHPYEMFFSRLGTYAKAIQIVFFKK